jgi:hypothetical protein
MAFDYPYVARGHISGRSKHEFSDDFPVARV